MSKPVVVFLVGHANWGKSQTLAALTGGSSYQRRITIKGHEFYIRRMSNDDDPKGLIAFAERVVATEKPNLIVAFCPNFTEPKAKTQFILSTLKNKGYSMFFFVLEHQYGTTETITQPEINQLKKAGAVEVYPLQKEAVVRAVAFQAFIANGVIA